MKKRVQFVQSVHLGVLTVPVSVNQDSLKGFCTENVANHHVKVLGERLGDPSFPMSPGDRFDVALFEVDPLAMPKDAIDFSHHKSLLRKEQASLVGLRGIELVCRFGLDRLPHNRLLISFGETDLHPMVFINGSITLDWMYQNRGRWNEIRLLRFRRVQVSV